MYWFYSESPFKALFDPFDLYPLDDNSVSRWIIIISVVLAAVLRSLWPLLVGAILLALFTVYQKPVEPTVGLEPDLTQIADMPAAESSWEDNIPEHMKLLPSDLLQSAENPYGNPLPYDDGLAVRTARPPADDWMKPHPDDDFEKRLWTGSGVLQPGLFYNRIPDPSLMGREPYWTSDPAPDIVSSQSALWSRRVGTI